MKKIAVILMVALTGCGGDDEVVPVAVSPQPPQACSIQYRGACFWSRELACWSCLHRVNGSDAAICRGR